jgi:hypothetical protein
MLRADAADKVLANRVLPGKVGYPVSQSLDRKR